MGTRFGEELDLNFLISAQIPFPGTWSYDVLRNTIKTQQYNGNVNNDRENRSAVGEINNIEWEHPAPTKAFIIAPPLPTFPVPHKLISKWRAEQEKEISAVNS